MRYIGGKGDLLNYIKNALGGISGSSVIDIFAGSGAVSSALAASGYKVLSNDILYFSYVVNRALLTPNEKVDLSKGYIERLNALTLESSGFCLNDCFIWQNYSPHEGCDRMYFQEKNALKIDLVRLTIEKWLKEGDINEDEYFCLLSRLIAAVPFVSNIAGVYGAYLKHWDARSYKDLTLTYLLQDNVSLSGCAAFNKNYQDLLDEVSADALYADPPYNGRQYLPNYHILETIARYDYPQISGISGMREYGESEKSDFCSKTKVHSAFESLIAKADVGRIVISYNNEGLIPTKDLTEICRSYSKEDSFRLEELPYRRYKSHSNGSDVVLEQLYMFDKK